MTKDQVKTVCEADDHLQWWAMVLFAEISELILHSNLDTRDLHDAKILYDMTKRKVEEFPFFIVQRTLDQAKDKLSRLDKLEQRVKKLETECKTTKSQ